MKLLNLVQKTQAWKSKRRTSITATDFAVIASSKGLSNNIYKITVEKLIHDKKNEIDIPDNKYFKLGRDNEEQLLSRFEGIHVIDGEVAASDENDNIIASFDGRDDILECTIEIKATTKDLLEFDKQFGYYQYQMIHQMHVAGYKKGYIIIGYFNKVTFKQCGLLTGEVDIELLNRDIWLEWCNEFLEKLK